MTLPYRELLCISVKLIAHAGSICTLYSMTVVSLKTICFFSGIKLIVLALKEFNPFRFWRFCPLIAIDSCRVTKNGIFLL